MRLRHHLPRLLLILMLVLLLQSCTNSKFIIGPLYNRLDDRMREEFNKLGDFNEEQVAAFEARLGTYHVWHRQSELPQYARLMSSVAGSIADADTTSTEVQQWFDEAETHSLAVRQCHPINFSFELMKSLTDMELNYIEGRFARQQKKNLARYNSRTPQERIERRLRNIIKWAGRIDLSITPIQRAMLLSAFKQQTSLRKEYYALSGEWNRQFFALARQQDNPDYDNDMSAHLNELWRLLESAHPEKWQANRDLWKNTSLRFVQSMTDEQRSSLSRWMRKMGSTLNAISKDTPSFTVIDDPALGCLVDRDNA